MGGSFRQAPDEPAQRVLRAIDIQTGKIAWELPQTGAVELVGRRAQHRRRRGVLRRGQRRADGGRRRRAAKPLWSFQTSQLWKASPMTYMFDDKQYVAVAAGSEHHRVRSPLINDDLSRRHEESCRENFVTFVSL